MLLSLSVQYSAFYCITAFLDISCFWVYAGGWKKSSQNSKRCHMYNFSLRSGSNNFPPSKLRKSWSRWKEWFKPNHYWLEKGKMHIWVEITYRLSVRDSGTSARVGIKSTSIGCSIPAVGSWSRTSYFPMKARKQATSCRFFRVTFPVLY